jgi:hypothetical protein
MAASDHLHPVQLRMFMTARELHDTPSAEVDPSNPAGWNTHREMWKSKRYDNVQDGLGADVAKRGVQYPVTLGWQRGQQAPKIDAGHHRIQAAYDANPESFVPVRHTDYTRGVPQEPQPVTNRFPSYP